MRLTGSRPMCTAGAWKGADFKAYLTMHELRTEHNGREGSYFMVSRGDKLLDPYMKSVRPDAVVVIGVSEQPGEPLRLVLTSEFRPAVGRREISFPAGLIDDKDYDPDSLAPERELAVTAAKRAAVREFREETGLAFIPTGASPPDLSSSAGMTNESVCVVMGRASGAVTDEHLEESEDIVVKLVTQFELQALLAAPPQGAGFSKVAWPFLWAFAKFGFECVPATAG